MDTNPTQREKELLDRLTGLRTDEQALLDHFNDIRASVCCEECEIGNSLDLISEERQPVMDELLALRRAQGGTIVVDYRKQFESRVQTLPHFAHYERLPEAKLAEALRQAPLACFVLHRSNEEVKRAVAELYFDGKWTRPTLWFTGEVDQVREFFGMPVVPRRLMERVVLPLLEKYHGQADGFERVLDAIAECRAEDYAYNDEERFERRFGLRVD